MPDSSFTETERNSQHSFRKEASYCERFSRSYGRNMSPEMIRLRSLWFQIHKWLGISLAILIIPISLTGAALVWHDWIDRQLYPERYPVAGSADLPPSAYAAGALNLAQPGEQISMLTFPQESGAVQITLTRQPAGGGRPSRAIVWLDPKSAQPIERGGPRDGALGLLHVIHGTFMLGPIGRQIVGWIGAAMLLSSALDWKTLIGRPCDSHPHQVSPFTICERSQSSFISRPKPGPSGTGNLPSRMTGLGPWAIFSLLPRNAPRTFSTLKRFGVAAARCVAA